MQRFILRLAIVTLAVLLAANVFQGQIAVSSIEGAILFSLMLGILNAFLRPILLLFTLPLTILTLGLFTLVVNALVFWLASQFPLGVAVNGFSGAFLGALTVSIVSFVASRAFK
jgi:putative membrane protein